MSAPLPSPPNLAITMTPVAGSMNWEPVRQRLLSSDLSDALQAATELRDNIEIVHSSELSLFLSALLPAFSSVLAHKTRPTPDASSVDHQLRHLILDIISKIPTGSVLRPHAPHCVALCIDILNRDYEENALLASRIIFDLYKAYRSLPQDYVQPYLDFVAGAYKSLPTAIQRNFALSALESAAAAASKQQASSDSTVASSTQGSPDGKEQSNKQEESSSVNNSPDKGPVPMDTSESPTSESAAAKTSSSPSTTAAAVETLPSEVAAPAPPKLLSVRANMSFRILTESPLIVMLMFQLWPGFLKTNIPVLIAVMMEALSLRAPPIQTIVPAKTSQQHKLDVNFKRMYYSRVRELVAAQAKTLSFVTYLLRSFLNELKPYEERLATNVVALMTTCPRESIATRKELLVATRHLLNTDFRKGFFRHVDSLLDERVLIGKGLSFSDQALLRPLGLTMLSDLVQHVRSSLNTSQTSRIVLMFARALHDSSNPLPISTQYTAVRTLLSMADVIFNNKDPNPQLGRDLLVRILITLTDKLQALSRYFPSVLEAEQARAAADSMYGEDLSKNRKDVEMDPLSEAPNDSVRDLQIMIRAIIVGHKSLIFYIYTYREQRVKDDPSPVVGANEEVASALQRLTHTEMAIIDKYILAAFPATRLMKENGPGSRATGDKSRAEHHREALTYFAAAFTCLDGYYLARTLGKRLDVLVDMLVEDPIAMVFVRHLLGANATTSLEFCSLLLDHLVERMDDLALPRHDGIVFFDPQVSGQETESTLVKKKLQRLDQRPHESDERKKQLGLALLQLFERVLKSLSAFPANEATVRKHLRHIVVVCFRSSMEQTNVWPDNYCMLLRYVFRAISAGKFEESYKELLPLLPTVLNGLYRVSASNDVPLRNTAVELCLTIPARLSSLLPHLNLLIRVIIPALDSKSGDLVNLGLRTLEFWVDNLNPLFLYPEMNKQSALFVSLMQSLSRHLRPAPYPYGLLTLRLLGKLGGNNREFLREPIPLQMHECLEDSPTVLIQCQWPDDCQAGTIDLKLPLGRIMKVLEMISQRPSDTANEEGEDKALQISENNKRAVLKWCDSERLWTESLVEIDFAAYNSDVVDTTLRSQAAACLTIVKRCIESFASDSTERTEYETLVYGRTISAISKCLFFASLITSTADEALPLLFQLHMKRENREALHESLLSFVFSMQSKQSVDIAVSVARNWCRSDDSTMKELLSLLCRECTSSFQYGLVRVISAVIEEMGSDLCREEELLLMSTAFALVKSVPREMSSVMTEIIRFFVDVCASLYGTPWKQDGEAENLIWDSLISEDFQASSCGRDDLKQGGPSCPGDDVFRLVLVELASSQQAMRFIARFVLTHYVAGVLSKDDAAARIQKSTPLLRKIFFSRSLRLLPLPAQVGVVEALAFIVKLFPSTFSLSEDQHFMSFLSELLKMASVADGEMADKALADCVVDKNGYASTMVKGDVGTPSFPSHASSVFLHRECIIDVKNGRLVCVEELPAGAQMRVSAIFLFHVVIQEYTDTFFEAEASNPVGNIRPHVISLLFRSLVSWPLRAVAAAHNALRDVLTLSMSTKEGDPAAKPQSRLPKELLQTCIRPVLLNLREHARLSPPLLRGLARLLSLLSNWFNRTLGEKLLDHLQKWTDPSGIMSLAVWKGDEAIKVAAAILEIFSLLPAASHFVDPLVKTCIRLEATLPVYKISFARSPFRGPLARYLNRHIHQTVAFFFPRLKTPTYSELFLELIQMDEMVAVRNHLSDKQCSVMILNICFERPLAIVRQDKNSSDTSSSKGTLQIHGIGPKSVDKESSETVKYMDVPAQESQIIGLRLVRILAEHDQTYFSAHSDIVRAFRWLWRSRGRLLRMQHEQFISPRYHDETSYLASFLMSYGKSFQEDGLDILFELVRGSFLASTNDCAPVITFINSMVRILNQDLKRQVVQRFFSLIAGESSEETKVLSIKYILLPMLTYSFKRESEGVNRSSLVDMQKFVKEVLPTTSGDRLKASLLGLCHTFIQFVPSDVGPFCNDIVKFCWGQLKSEDSTCKGWSHLVLSCLVKCCGVPAKVVQQLYISLLRSHQQEGRNFFRASIDTLLPCLQTRLSEELHLRAINRASKVMLEEGNSTPQLAHICQIVVRNHLVFEGQKVKFISHMVNALGRLGLPPNLENRVLAVSVVELLLLWTNDEYKDSLFNFLVRLKLLIAEKNDTLAYSIALESRISKLLASIVGKAPGVGIDIHAQAFDKALRDPAALPCLLVSCLEILCVFVEGGEKDFFDKNEQTLCELLGKCLKTAKDDLRVQMYLRRFVVESANFTVIPRAMLMKLDTLLQTIILSRRTSSNRAGTRSREQDAEESILCFYLELVAIFCRQSPSRVKLVESSLLSLGTQLLESSSKQQRHGSYANHNEYHSPTSGIIQGACLTAAIVQNKARVSKEGSQSMLIILEVFQSCSNMLAFTFTQGRKALFHLLASIMDTTDKVELLVAACRMVCSWILSESVPMTTHEKNNFLLRLTSGMANLPDMAAQPVVDVVNDFIEQLMTGDRTAFSKSVMSCLMTPKRSQKKKLFRMCFSKGSSQPQTENTVANRLIQLLQSNFEGVGGRFYGILFVDGLLDTMASDTDLMAVSLLAHGDAVTGQHLLEQVLPAAWNILPNDGTRIRVKLLLETFLSRMVPVQFLKDESDDAAPQNSIRSFLLTLGKLRPAIVIDEHLLVYLAENYNAWHEVLELLERQYPSKLTGEVTLGAIRHCYRLLGEQSLCLSVARESCRHNLTKRAIWLDMNGYMKETVNQYEDLVTLLGTESDAAFTDFEVELWQERWSELQCELDQLESVKEFSKGARNHLELEVSWKTKDWNRVRSLTTSEMLAYLETGDPLVKIAETILCVAEGKLADVENLHAQSAQLALQRWQLLPQITTGSSCHSSLLHTFHRLVEIREAGQVMVEAANHTQGRTLPDLKNLLSAWRHRVPLDSDSLRLWSDIVSCRCYIYETLCSKFDTQCDSNTLAGLHDRPWTIVRMAKAARKQSLGDMSLNLLNRAVDHEGAMSVSDAFFKLREQILVCDVNSTDSELQGGLNLLSTTNLSYFDSYQKSELFRIKAIFLASLGGRSKANQAHCHSAQICPGNGRAWECWGSLCLSLASSTEKSGGDGGDQKVAAKKVSQYLAQAMGCYLEAISIDANEWARIHLPKCLFMLTKDGDTPGVLCNTLESRGSQLPPWVWLPWLAQLLTSFCRPEGKSVKSIFARVSKSYPQAVYYALRTFYLERRDAERAKNEQPSTTHMPSVVLAEEMMSLLRRSHTYLWGSLEAILEELIVKFRPTAEEELLGPIIALLERAETQQGSPSRTEDGATSLYIWKTIWRIASKFFKENTSGSRQDGRLNKTSRFKEKYRDQFEKDFHVDSSSDGSPPPDTEPPMTLNDFTVQLRQWRQDLESSNGNGRCSMFSLMDASPTLASFVVGDFPGLWSGSCDSKHVTSWNTDGSERYQLDKDTSSAQSTSSSVTAARKAASTAAAVAAAAAAKEGVGGDYGGGSAVIEIPGQYVPNSSEDGRPRPELHAKLVKFNHKVELLRRGDQLVRRVSMIGSDGKTYPFLVQAAVPYWTRVEERSAQFSFVLAKCLRKDIQASRNHYSMYSQPVIPLAQRLRLVSDPTGRITLDDVLQLRCERKQREKNAVLTQFNEDVKEIATNDMSSDDSKENNTERRLAAFQKASISSSSDNTMLREHVYAVLGGPEQTFAFRKLFSQQWAFNCLLQHAFTVSERTPARVSFIESTGSVLSPEFRVSYSNQGFIDSTVVPFRLTVNLSTLIGFPLLDGRFALSMSTLSGVVRNFKTDLVPILKLLMRDDLLAFYTRSMPKSDAKTQEMEKQLKDRFAKNTALILAKLSECAVKIETDSATPVDARVSELIDMARNPENLCKMPGNYQAWL